MKVQAARLHRPINIRRVQRRSPPEIHGEATKPRSRLRLHASSRYHVPWGTLLAIVAVYGPGCISADRVLRTD
jgi:hypothetical protein